jgi:hypothetical protein
MDLTKAAFVVSAEAGARMAVEAYMVGLDAGLGHDEAMEMAADDATEGAMCFTGIGSCGRGWCKHS